MSEEEPAVPSGKTPAARAPEPSEFPSLFRLVNAIFHVEGGSMAAHFPRLLTETNRANIRVIVEDGEVVSHAAQIIRDAALSGVRVRVALLGAVATDKEARGRGYATKCVAALAERAVEDAADYMIISGSRGLYHRLGARPVGDDMELHVTAERARALAREGIEVRSFGEENLLDAVDLCAAENVRFIRPLEDWQAAVRWGFARCGRCTFLGAWEVGRLAAYAVLHRPDKGGVSFVVEYGGARGVLIGALSRIIEYMKAKKLKLHLGHQDDVLGARLAAAGIEGRRVSSDGITLVLNFESLMRKLRTRFLEKAGESAARELSFSEEGPALGLDNKFRIACGPDVITVEGRGTLAEFIFGAPGCLPVPASGTQTGRHGPPTTGDEAPVAPTAERSGPAPVSGAESCLKLWGASGPFRAALPAPTLLYGLNFI